MLIRGEDDILEGISGLLLSWDKREKRVYKSSLESFNTLKQYINIEDLPLPGIS